MSTMTLPVVSDGFEHYMAQVNRFELLTPDEERHLAHRYRNHGDIDAAHRLITGNLRFVVKVANEYRNYGLRLADLVQEGNIGLMMAVKKFDPERGIRLITYAVWWIRAYIQNYIVKSWSLVKIGTTQTQKKLFFKLRQTRDALRKLTGRSDMGEIAEHLDVQETEVVEMTQRLRGRDSSLDVELSPGEDYTLLDSLADDRANQEELLAEHQESEQNRQQVEAALAILKPRDRAIIERRILTETPETLQDLADEYGISRERVRQLEANALKKMKEALCRNPSPATN